MTQCEEKGLKKGQWVWRMDKNAPPYNEVNSNTIKPGWVSLVWDDGSSAPMFYDGVGKDFGELRFIDFTQGIHNTKPLWTPKEYGGEGPPEERSVTTIQKWDYILREDIPDKDTFDAIMAECGRQRIEKCGVCEDGLLPKHRGILLLGHIGVSRMNYLARSDGRRLTPADLGIDPKWDGKGLPPVGTVCEFVESETLDLLSAFDDWKTGDVLEVVAHRRTQNRGRKDVIVVWNRDREIATSVVPDLIRPVRTKRERVIESAKKEIGEADIDTLERLYDAGCLRAPKENADE